MEGFVSVGRLSDDVFSIFVLAEMCVRVYVLVGENRKEPPPSLSLSLLDLEQRRIRNYVFSPAAAHLGFGANRANLFDEMPSELTRGRLVYT